MSTIDYHVHSKASSDADHSPREIMEMAKENGLKIIAITDHNSIKSVKEAMKLGEQFQIKVIAGTEIDCVFEGVHFHMTAYNFDLNDPWFEQHEKDIRVQEIEVTWAGTRNFLNKMNLDLNEETLNEIARDGCIVPEDLGHYLLSHREYDDLVWLDSYRKGGTRSDNPDLNFYWDYFSQGKIGYVPIELKDAKDVIQAIHKAHGVAVVAHPKANFKNKDEILERLLELVDGLEVYSTYHDEEDISHYKALAQKYQLFMSAGSDYHGHHKPKIQIGHIPGLDKDDSEVIRL